MRLWSLHPRYLDPVGLIALWREALLAQAVLAGQTRGYKNHPQLSRFLQSPAPAETIACYLRFVHAEATRRGYCFNAAKIVCNANTELLSITQGQLDYEWSHLTTKLKIRNPAWLEKFKGLDHPDPHPLFKVIPGGIAEWEVGRNSELGNRNIRDL